MIKNYYQSEYSPKGWVALRIKAQELGCALTSEESWSGKILTVDSTPAVDRLIKAGGVEGTGETCEVQVARAYWAEFIQGEVRRAGKYKQFLAVPDDPQRYQVKAFETLDGAWCYADKQKRVTKIEWFVQTVERP